MLPPHCGAPENREEQIGGADAQVIDLECDGVHVSVARWTSPQVYLEGRAADSAAAGLLLSVYRSVRF